MKPRFQYKTRCVHVVGSSPGAAVKSVVDLRPWYYDEHIYKWRHLVENYFAKIKEFRSIATRYEKTTASYEANWYLTATIIELR